MIVLQAFSTLFETPEHISPQQWEQIQTMLIWLWAFTGSMVVFAGTLLIGHGLIPSLTSTRDLPMRFMNFRPIILGISALFFIATVFCLVSFIISLQHIYDIYPRVWI